MTNKKRKATKRRIEIVKFIKKATKRKAKIVKIASAEGINIIVPVKKVLLGLCVAELFPGVAIYESICLQK
jgi:translation initiation factor 2 gamma subunit (eIF-2gamma)